MSSIVLCKFEWKCYSTYDLRRLERSVSTAYNFVPTLCHMILYKAHTVDVVVRGYFPAWSFQCDYDLFINACNLSKLCQFKQYI